MIEQLFGSGTRVKLLRLFLSNPKQAYYVREITRRLGLRINAVRQELNNLKSLDILTSYRADGKKFYQTNREFVLYPEIKALILKSQMTLEKDLVEQIKKIGSVRYLVLTGKFTNSPETQTDMLIVGKLNRTRLEKMLKDFASNYDFEISYTVMSSTEYIYRKGLTDRFLFNILENKKIVILDKIN